MIKHEIVELSDIWGFLDEAENSPKDAISSLLNKQKEALNYQYTMLFKTIMNQNSINKEQRQKIAE